MLFQYLDIADLERRIRFQSMTINRLNDLGAATEEEEIELIRLSETLSHLRHHRQIMEYSIRASRVEEND